MPSLLVGTVSAIALVMGLAVAGCNPRSASQPGSDTTGGIGTTGSGTNRDGIGTTGSGTNRDGIGTTGSGTGGGTTTGRGTGSGTTGDTTGGSTTGSGRTGSGS
jgi:hypothetical protein